jgi:hypothetical protein
MRGLRVHLSGSAATDCDGDVLAAAHGFVRAFTTEVIGAGGGLVLGAGGEPRGDSGEPCIFDWTALEVLASSPDPAPQWPPLRPERFVVVASQRGLEKVPEWRADVWDKGRRRTDFDLEPAPAGWRMAGIIRERQVLRGDILVALGGGAGVEHLAELYQDEGKPVIPIYAELGAINRDGNGGSRSLHERALGGVGAFFRLHDGAGSAAARLSSLRLTATTDVDTLAKETAALVAELRPRPAFYVRLLASDHPDFAEVERFFRDVVDAVVVERGFTPQEMGRAKPEAAFMNVEIFQALHRAGMVVVDLTGVRPNCTMELGYALARRRRVVISAKKGTELPFDPDKLPTYAWEESTSSADRVAAYRDWFDRYNELAPLVS